ncbi:MAG: O-antigen ligase family protein [Terriglobia bacterium]
MIALITTAVCIAAILWLFFLDRDDRSPSSAALWIPVAWLLINGSRPVSQWLHRSTVTPLAVQYTEGNGLDAAIFGILIIAALAVLNFRWRQVRDLLRDNLPIVLFFSYCALSILWSDHSFIALKRWSKAMGDLAMVLVVLTDPSPLPAIKRVFARVTFILMPLSVLLIVAYPSLGRAYDPTDYTVMYVGVTTFKNLLGMICMVCGVASLWSFVGAYEDAALPHRRRHLLAHGLMVATAMGLILIANSMTSFSCLSLAGAVVVMTALPWVRKRPRRVHLIVAAAIALPVFALFISTVGTLVHMLGRNSTLTDRTSIWRAVLAMHTNPWIGTGFESFWMGSRLQAVWDLSVRGIQEAHNGYLEVYINLGWIGVALLMGLIVSGYRNAFAAFRRDPNAGRIRLGFFTAAIIYCFTEAGFRMLNPTWIAFLLAILKTPAVVQSLAREGVPALPSLRGLTKKRVRVLQ